jgi:tetratricopeptide (TPR) repeat protein
MRSLLLSIPFCLLGSLALAATVDLGFQEPSVPDLPEVLSLEDGAPLDGLQEELERQVEATPDDAEAWHRLGTVRFRRDDRTGAGDAWQRAHGLDDLYAPADVMAATQEVFLRLAAGDTEGALSALEQASVTFAGSPYFHLIRAEQAMRNRAFEAAEEAYRSAIDADPNYFASKLNLGRYLEFVGRQEEAREMYEAAVADAPDRAMTWDFLGTHQFSGGEVEAALESFRNAERAGDEQPLAEFRLATLFKATGDLIGARHWYLQALARSDAETRISVLMALADTQLRLRLWEDAAATLDEVIDAAPSAPVLVARGTVAEQFGELEQAAALYRDAVRADPGNVVASNNLAMVLVRLGINPEEALLHSRAALERRPDNAAIGGTYAVALAHAGENAAALQALRRNVRISPDDPWIRYFLARLLLEQGQIDEARLQLEAVSILDPEFDRLAEVEELLAR